MADLFESLLPEASWPRGKPGMGEIVSEGARKGYEYLIRPMASPAGMAIGAAFGAAPKALAAIGGAALGGLGIAQGVKAAEEGESGLDVALPLAMGAAGMLGLAALQGRIAKGLIRGKAGAIPEEMLALGGRQLELPMNAPKTKLGPPLGTAESADPTFRYPPPGRQPAQREMFKTAQQKSIAPWGETLGETIPAADPSRPLWQSQVVESLNKLADPDGIVEGSRLKEFLMNTRGGLKEAVKAWKTEEKEAVARVQPKSKQERETMLAGLQHREAGIKAQEKLRAATQGGPLDDEMEAFGVASSLFGYLRDNPGRERFSLQELRAVGALDLMMDNQVYGEMFRYRGEPLRHAPSSQQELHGSKMWSIQNLVGVHASPPAQDLKTHFDLFVTFNPEMAKRLGWEEWRDGHWFYDDVINPVVRLRMGRYTTEEGRNALVLLEVQGPFESAGDELAVNYPAFFRDNNRWMKIGARRALRYAAENGYDLIAWPTGKMIDAIQTPDFPHVRWEEVNRAFPTKGIMWRKTSSGEFFITSRAEHDIGVKSANRTYTPDELYSFLGKQATDKILQQAEGGSTEGTVKEGVWENPRPLGWTQAVYDKNLHNIMNEEGKVWRLVDTGRPSAESAVKQVRIDFPDDRNAMAWGEFPEEEPVSSLYHPPMRSEREAAQMSLSKQRRAAQAGMLRETNPSWEQVAQTSRSKANRPTLDPNRWFSGQVLGLQPVWAIEIRPTAMQAPVIPAKSSHMTALVPPAVGLGLVAATSDKGDQ